ncbi:unnamed protein product [Cuscuta campestris]|uniref:Cytochrome b561 domain-containing protein n=1 Tax=Cuscuta campestris TaxID=132261 RepID=A0A484MHM6_9ASTE|nr:unnamed protein product [Cuscuta campestris]
MLVWLLHFRGGLNLNSHDPNRVFNVHPFLMFFGFMFFLAQGLVVYDGMVCRVVAISLGGVGIRAAIKSHHTLNFGSHMRSLHSWIGIAAFSLFVLELAFGILKCCGDAAENSKEKPRKSGPTGRTVLYMATCAALSGLMERSAAMDDLDGGGGRSHRESTIINVLALFILLFAVSIDKAVVYAVAVNGRADCMPEA